MVAAGPERHLAACRVDKEQTPITENETVERTALTDFLEAHLAYREALQDVKALERQRDAALLDATREGTIPELAAASGMSRERVRRIVNRARRASRSWIFATRRDRPRASE